MQESCYDYSQEEVGNGCCLNCYEKHDGCLCYKCKCKKCYWYCSPYNYDGNKGHCDKVEELIAENKERFKKKKEKENGINGEKLKILNEQNKEKEQEIKSKGEIPSWYSCQKCGCEFVTEEELNILQRISPICNICNGLIKLRLINGENN